MKSARVRFVALSAAVVLAAVPSAAGASDKKTERTWRANCASCHGRDGTADTEQGRQMKIPSMAAAEWQKKLTDEQIRSVIRDGLVREESGLKKEMEPFKEKLKPAEIDAMLEYIRAFAPSS